MSTELRPTLNDRNAERALLGAMLRDSAIIAEVAGVLKPDQLYVFAHQKIFECMIALADKGIRVDITTVVDWLRRKGLLNDIGHEQGGGECYVSDLWDAATSAKNAGQYIAILKDYALRRRLILASTEIGEESNSRYRPCL